MNEIVSHTNENQKYLQQLMNDILEVRYTDINTQLKYCNELLILAEQEGSELGIAFALTYLADYYLACNDSSTSGEFLERAIELCERNSFNELLMNVHIFYGLYYSMLLERQMTLSHILSALEIGILIGDVSRRTVILNNIANIFEYVEDFEKAKKYYKEAMLYAHDPSDFAAHLHNYPILTANFVNMCCIVGDLESAVACIQELSITNLDTAESVESYHICLCHLAAVKKDLPNLCKHADILLNLLDNNMSSASQFYEMLLYVVEHLLLLGDKERARNMLLTHNKICSNGEEGIQLKAQNVWIKYYEKFGTEEQQGWAYKRYYKLRTSADVSTNKAMAEGLKAKIHLYGVRRQQEEILQANKKLENETLRDSLTHLYNRRALSVFVKKAISDEAVYSIGFAMIDVDYFKQYNDNYGHGEGDKALITVANCMSETTGSNENIYNFRYGGDEFMCMYKNCSEDDMKKYISKVVEKVHSKGIEHEYSHCSNIISLSIGFYTEACLNGQYIDETKIMACADKALYKAKELGRNRYCSYTEL